MKTTILVLFGVALIAFVFAFDYDCSGKVHGIYNYPHPVDCKKFVTCSHGLAYERDCVSCEIDPIQCPEGLLTFDHDSRRCLYANEAKCQSQSSILHKVPDTAIEFDCTGKSHGIYNYPHPVDCKKYITCSHEIAYERNCAACEIHPIQCPQGRLLFDQDSSRCLYANEAKCQSQGSKLIQKDEQ